MHNLRRDIGFVHGINMNPAYIVRDKVDDLLSRVRDAGLLHCGRFIAEFIDDVHKPRRQNSPAQLHYTLYLYFICYRHNACKYRYVNAFLRKFIQKFI